MNAVPQTINFNEADVASMGRRKVLKNGWYEGIVQAKATTKLAKTGSLMMYVPISVLDAEGEPTKYKTDYRIILPVANPEHEGHTAPNTGGFCHSYLNAVNADQFPRFPKREGTEFVLPDGTVMTNEEASEFRTQLNTKIVKEMVSRWNDPDSFEDDTLFFQVQRNDKDYPEIVRVSGEAPDGEEVICEDFVA